MRKLFYIGFTGCFIQNNVQKQRWTRWQFCATDVLFVPTRSTLYNYFPYSHCFVSLSKSNPENYLIFIFHCKFIYDKKLAQFYKPFLCTYQKINVMTSFSINTSNTSAAAVLSIPSSSSYNKKSSTVNTVYSYSVSPKTESKKSSFKFASVDWDLNMNELEFE